MPWLPDRLMDKDMDAVKLAGILRRGANVVAKVEAYIRPRAQACASPAAVSPAALTALR